jgi:hypothetical protein
LRRLLRLTLLLGACARAGDDAPAGARADSAPAAEVRATPVVAFRLGAGSGPLRVYRLPTLEANSWGAGGAISGARGAVAADLLGRRLLYLDTAGALTSYDLVALRERPVVRRGARAAIAADGTVLAVDSSGDITESQPWGTRGWPGSLGRGVRAIFAAPGARLLAVRSGRTDSLVFASREGGIVAAGAIPRGTAVIASRDGDAVAIATDSAVVVYEDREFPVPWSVLLDGRPQTVAFSPSGHRLYVALADRDEIAVIDRFAREERSAIALPGPAAALRPDPWGRVLLVRGADGAIWVASLADERVVGRLQAGWADDLPVVTRDAVLLTREGGAVVARDARSLDSLAALAGAAGDVWFAGPWSPPSVAAAARQRADTGSARAQAAAKRLAPAGTTPATSAWWVQVASSRNSEAAQALAEELRAQRQPARVEDPRKDGDPWRVLTGPWPTRNAADSAGRSLGRPYFVVERSHAPGTAP